MLLITSLQSIIPNPRAFMGVASIDLLILSGALLPSKVLVHMNLQIRWSSLFSSAVVNLIVAPMKSICDKPNVLQICIFPSIDKCLLDHDLSWENIMSNILFTLASLACDVSKLRIKPFTFIQLDGLTGQIMLLYLIS